MENGDMQFWSVGRIEKRVLSLPKITHGEAVPHVAQLRMQSGFLHCSSSKVEEHLGQLIHHDMRIRAKG
ncbi:hypothetical protein CDAR_227281 [Caerostris darwini]|uniref:Uncharacterized protein n=1 Tax=Caerostris darwini TaxID=1538125 RepID=A0AAV4ULZ3_9ARAC|nr:hypothetical protein CDAR_227281 [Caerostris darwini]